jgi:hypothetical protein
LGATDLADEDDFDADAAGADGMGVPDVSRWENDDSGGQDSSNSKAAPVGWLEDDDIEAWDSD